MNHLMVDLETWGNTTDAAITAIGLAHFNEDTIITNWQLDIDLKDSLRYGTASASTLQWWLTQDNATIKANFVNRHKVFSLKEALGLVSDIYHDEQIEAIWGNGSVFDITILQHAYEKLEIPVPWHYRAPRDQRTLKDILVMLGLYTQEFEQELDKLWFDNKLLAHSAVHDAIGQAMTVQLYFKKLREAIKNK